MSHNHFVKVVGPVTVSATILIMFAAAWLTRPAHVVSRSASGEGEQRAAVNPLAYDLSRFKLYRASEWGLAAQPAARPNPYDLSALRLYKQGEWGLSAAPPAVVSGGPDVEENAPLDRVDYARTYRHLRNRSPECFDVPLREAATCSGANRTPVKIIDDLSRSYRQQLAECFDVPLKEAASCAER